MKFVLGITNPKCGLLKTSWAEITAAYSRRVLTTSRTSISYTYADRLPYHRWSYVNGCPRKIEPCTYANFPVWNGRHYTTGPEKNAKETGAPELAEEEKKLSIFQKFKVMYKKYWYVLVPVHLVTSIGWFGGFYYLAKSGVDVVSLLESWNFSEVIIKPLRDSSAGYVAVAYALYKIATPVRYTVTLGGTTVSINYLTKWGLIKPIPPKEKLKEMYEEGKENLKERRDQLKEKGEAFMREFRDRSNFQQHNSRSLHLKEIYKSEK
ncbi:uncharacterized protein C18orf19 homolog A isoform X1 [Schistocerca gregaria]|uniref:uncharacterized protein C18orf19 homolog A isoform X1 n=1 Tax=Schistocerca gregaria TaxID=7010 RepID=UPI00211E9170|nr:uncharacterized protein C18orf19 homolog A isoform X1 [Schistocerca gregaria]